MKKRKGAAMIWACLLFLIGSLIVGTLTSWGISYHKKSINEMSENQAYLTARSGAELIARHMIDNPSADGISDIIEKLNTDKNVTIEDMGFDKYNMGKCKVELVEKEDDNGKVMVTITSTATYDEMTDKVIISMEKIEGGDYQVTKMFLGELLKAGEENKSLWQWDWDGNWDGVIGLPRDEMPEMTTPKDAEKLATTDSSEYILGKPNKDSYYCFEKGVDYGACKISTGGTSDGKGNVYVFVKSGAEVTATVVNGLVTTDVDGTVDQVFKDGKPVINLFIFVEEGGSFIIQGEETLNAFIYDKHGRIDDDKDTGANILQEGWYGGLTCFEAAIGKPKKGFTTYYRGPLPGYPNKPESFIKSGSGSGAVWYEFVKYLDE